MTSTLQTIARVVGARRILEIGTGDGQATLQLASALPPDGLLITMEADPAVAATARRQFAAAGYGDRISVIVGEPLRFLHKVSGPFDVVSESGVSESGVSESGASGVPRERLLALLRAGGVLITSNKKAIIEKHDPALSIQVKDMTIAEWLAAAKADAQNRGLVEIIPMLEGLAQASERLRAAGWNDDADKDTPRDLDQ